MMTKAFEREAKSLAKARHETVPYVRDYFCELDRQYLVMRERILSLAADFDRIERAGDGGKVLSSDPRSGRLKEAITIVLNQSSNRAEQVQMLLSDTSPRPTPREVRVNE